MESTEIISAVGEHIPKKMFLGFPADSLPGFRDTLERVKTEWKKQAP